MHQNPVPAVPGRHGGQPDPGGRQSRVDRRNRLRSQRRQPPGRWNGQPRRQCRHRMARANSDPHPARIGLTDQIPLPNNGFPSGVLAQRNGLPPSSWGVGSSNSEAARRLGISRDAIKDDEADLEKLVSQYIGRMPFLWLNVPDEPGPASRRGFLEQNAIALLSSFKTPAIDRPSSDWAGPA